ncbi:MAG: hypothetical protein KDE56_27370, partial [Anaerolineales bacterium]|nr:hypothetical protein [Anaerolineales bacterium]
MQLPEISHSSVGSTKRLQPLAIWPLTTTPLADVIVLLVALPVFWLVGVEQFLPMLLLGWAAIKLLLTRRTLRLTPLGILFFLFLLLQIVSATSIDLRTNWIVFAKNFASYLAGFLIFLIIVNQVKSVRQYRLLVGCMVILISLITLIGVLFIVGLLPGKFEALGARFIPGFLRGSEFVQQNIILREVGRPQARLGSVTYPRVSSVFLFPTTAAVGYLIFLPFLAYVRQQAVGLKRGLITLL